MCDDKVTEVLSKLTEQLSRIEAQLKTKADASHVELVELAIKLLDNKVCDKPDTFTQVVERSRTDNTKTEAAIVEAIEAIKQLENKVCNNFDTFAQVVERSRTENAKADAANVEAIEVMVKELQNKSCEQKQEEEDRERRKCNIIIYGLQEPSATEAEEKRNEDSDLAQLMLHKISCDDISVGHITRLGPPPESAGSKPRPVKLTVNTVDARDKILRQSKNLRAIKEEVWKTVFIHQDLTPREREARKLLVQELKARKLAGETNLIIVSGKIVTKRMYGY